MLYSHSQPNADIRVLTIGRKIMSIKKSQMRADLKALDKADKSISSILEKYIPFFEKDNKMKDIKTDMQEVQVGIIKLKISQNIHQLIKYISLRNLYQTIR